MYWASKFNQIHSYILKVYFCAVFPVHASLQYAGFTGVCFASMCTQFGASGLAVTALSTYIC